MAEAGMAQKLHSLNAHGGSEVTCVTIGSHSGGVIATGGGDKSAHIFRVDTGKRVMSLRHTSSLSSLAFSKREAKLVAGSAGGGVLVFDLGDAGKRGGGMRAHRTDVSAVAMHPFNESFVATGGGDTTAKLWDLRGRDCLHTFKKHSGGVGVTRFSPNGAWLITGGDDGAAHVWDLRVTGKRIASLEGGRGRSGGAAVTCVEFHPTELLVATGSADRSARIFDLDPDAGRGVGATLHARAPSAPLSTGALLATIHESASIHSLVFTRDGHALCTATDDALNVWTGAWEGAPLEKVAKFSMRSEAEWSSVTAMWSSKDSSQVIAVGRRADVVATWVMPLGNGDEPRGGGDDGGYGAVARLPSREQPRTSASRAAAAQSAARTGHSPGRSGGRSTIRSGGHGGSSKDGGRGRPRRSRYAVGDDDADNDVGGDGGGAESGGAYGHRRAEVYREERERTRITRAERARAQEAEEDRARAIRRRQAELDEAEERRAREEREEEHRRYLAASAAEAEASAAERVRNARTKAVRVAAEYEEAERHRRTREKDMMVERQRLRRTRSPTAAAEASAAVSSAISAASAAAERALELNSSARSFAGDQSYGYGDEAFEDDEEEEEEDGGGGGGGGGVEEEVVAEDAALRSRFAARLSRSGGSTHSALSEDIVEEEEALRMSSSSGRSSKRSGSSTKYQTPSRVVNLSLSHDSPVYFTSPLRDGSGGGLGSSGRSTRSVTSPLSPGSAIAAVLGRSFDDAVAAAAPMLSVATPLRSPNRDRGGGGGSRGEDTLGETVILPPRVAAAVDKAAAAAAAARERSRGAALRAAGASSLNGRVSSPRVLSHTSPSGGAAAASLLDSYASSIAAAHSVANSAAGTSSPTTSSASPTPELSPEVERAASAAARRRRAAEAKDEADVARDSVVSPPVSALGSERKEELSAMTARELKHRAFALRVPLAQTRQCVEKRDLVDLILLHEARYFAKNGRLPATKTERELTRNEVHAPDGHGGAVDVGGGGGRGGDGDHSRARGGRSAGGGSGGGGGGGGLRGGAGSRRGGLSNAPRERAPGRPRTPASSRPSSAAAAKRKEATPDRYRRKQKDKAAQPSSRPKTPTTTSSPRRMGAPSAVPTDSGPVSASAWDCITESDYYHLDSSRLIYNLSDAGFAFVKSSREDADLKGNAAAATRRLTFADFIPKRLHAQIRAEAFLPGDEGERAVAATNSLLASSLDAMEVYPTLTVEDIESLQYFVSHSHAAETKAMADELSQMTVLKDAWASLGEYGRLEACIKASDLVRSEEAGAIEAVATWLSRIDFGSGEWSLQHCVVLLTAIAKVRS